MFILSFQLSICPIGSTNNYSISIISDCLRLIKNILHIPNEQYQNTILWMIFSERFDEVYDIILYNILNYSNKSKIIFKLKKLKMLVPFCCIMGVGTSSLSRSV